jgi:hypothetical protein
MARIASRRHAFRPQHEEEGRADVCRPAISKAGLDAHRKLRTSRAVRPRIRAWRGRRGQAGLCGFSGDIGRLQKGHRGRACRGTERDDAYPADGNASATQGHHVRHDRYRIHAAHVFLPCRAHGLWPPVQRFRIVLHQDHPLAAQKRITAAALAKQKFVAYELDAEIGFGETSPRFSRPARSRKSSSARRMQFHC